MIVILNAETVCHPQVLSTGAVVVDLPGVRDANAARGAVAEKYMKSCNAVWIVADITTEMPRCGQDELSTMFAIACKQPGIILGFSLN